MKRICVYCGSGIGKNPDYHQAAKDLGAELAKRNIELIYGGASIGLMGVLADSVLAGGGRVTGIIPRFLVEKELSHKELSTLIIVDSMHQRKTKMADLADGFIALPGGFGTFEELFEILTWRQLGFHQKPCSILNVDGYYNKLAEFLKKAVDEGFIKRERLDILIFDDNPFTLLDAMQNYSHNINQHRI